MRFAPSINKIPYLTKAISKIDKIKFFAEIAWENKLTTTKEFSEFLIQIQNIGKELGGWKKGLIKNSSQERGETL
ncbi:MAG: four helix bundle protein [Patescibacteria group bacterium]